MSNKWTKEQLDAIEKNNSNILVAAAAGSGKTTVLVERIIRKIVEEKIDIDKIVVVTFTNAAASEMRNRILEAIYQKLEENPEDEVMQRQINLLNKANISTIDSFCLNIIKNNFYLTDISANARVADSTEIELLKQETIEEIFEDKYQKDDKDFLKLIDIYTSYNKDEEFQDLILKIYKYIQAFPFPEDWLKEKVNDFKDYDKSNFANTKWGKIICNQLEGVLDDGITRLNAIYEKMIVFDELEKFSSLISKDIEVINKVKSNISDWDKLVELIGVFTFDKWKTDKSVTNELKDEAKDLRSEVKDEIKKFQQIINEKTQEINADMEYVYKVLKMLETIILEFSSSFYNKKREKNIIDYEDMEHLALKILVSKDDKGNIIKTDIAKKYSEKFEEIAIDEYQDSNLVQELILNSVSRDNNIFMVGDVKQSIYKFRQARPELFLEKYESYKLEPKEKENRKIQLFKNFRSRQNILDFTNTIFTNIMSYDLGQIEYNEDEFLNLGAHYEEIADQDLKTEINIIDTKIQEENIWIEESKDESEDDSSEDLSEEIVEDVIVEAKFVANKIKDLIDSKYQVVDKDNSTKEKIEYRDIKPKDIVVLLRNANTVSSIYEKEIADLGINVYSDISESYLQSTEIEIIISLLKIISNPMSDIDLVTVLRSHIGNFSDNELLEISLFGTRKESFYEKMVLAKDNTKNSALKEKIESFLAKLNIWRKEEKYKPLDELIWQIYVDTGYIEYVNLLSNGELRVANLKLLFEKAKAFECVSFKGINNFINYIDRIKLNNKDMSAAKIISENEDVVRIMSIHKSKGLEFPVVILAQTGKNFNMQDYKEKIILHQDLGIGPEYIDDIRHIEFKTPSKMAITILSKKELLAEEMRVLYVALTRAKEKLIIVGMQKDVSKELKQKTDLIYAYKNNEKEKINPFLVQKYKKYLDWIELVLIKEKSISDIITLNMFNKKDLLKQVKEEKEKKESIKEKVNNLANSKEFKDKEKLKEILSWKYDFDEIELPTNTSATSLKKIIENVNKFKNSEEIEVKVTEEMSKPEFIDEEGKKLSAAEIGTLMHLCVQKMNEKIEYDEDKVKEMIDSLLKKDIITKKQAESINVERLLKYTKSNLWEELKQAKKIVKEKPFHINISGNEIIKDDNKKIDDNILVQGIIDLYYIDKDNNLVLVDYKTDYIEKGKEKDLIEHYKVQLGVYKNALEQSLNRKVDKVELFSLYLNEEIIIDI